MLNNIEKMYEEKKLFIYHKNGTKEETINYLIIEKPLYIKVNSKLWSIVMRSPQFDKELALGLLYSEGIINNISEIDKIEDLLEKDSINFIIKNKLFQSTPKKTVSYSSGEKVNRINFNKNKINSELIIDYKIIIEKATNLKNEQALFLKTHASHAVALYDKCGELIFLAEDVGRHNAMDKVIGYILLNNISVNDKFFVLSGRGSLEMVYKTINISIPLLSCISIPTYKALKVAKEYNLALVQIWGMDKMMVLESGLVNFNLF